MAASLVYRPEFWFEERGVGAGPCCSLAGCGGRPNGGGGGDGLDAAGRAPGGGPGGL